MLRFALSLIICAQLSAGQVFLYELLSRLRREAATQADREVASVGLTKLHAGQIEAALGVAKELTSRAATPELRALKPVTLGQLIDPAPKAQSRNRPLLLSVLDLSEAETERALAGLTAPQLAVFRWVEDLSGGILAVRRVPDAVKRFTVQHRMGMDNAQFAYAGLRPDMASYLRSLLSVLPDRLVAVVHTREGDPLIVRVRQSAQREGKTVFSYLDCLRMFHDYCPDSFVGAVMAHAGTTLLADTDNVMERSFTVTEALSVARARQRQRALILISDTDVANAKRIAQQQIAGVLVTVADPNSP